MLNHLEVKVIHLKPANILAIPIKHLQNTPNKNQAQQCHERQRSGVDSAIQPRRKNPPKHIHHTGKAINHTGKRLLGLNLRKLQHKAHKQQQHDAADNDVK